MSEETRVGMGQVRPGARYTAQAEIAQAIRSAVREALGGALAEHVEPGTSVLLKPNWVLDHNRSGATMECMITHRHVVEAVLAEVAAARPARIVLADAPVQSAVFDTIAPAAWRDHLASLARGVPFEVLDLRNVITRSSRGRFINVAVDRRLGRMSFFDLGADSLLEEVSVPYGNFRCANYDPRRMQEVQRQGVHKYAISKEALEAELIINLPKLKCHRKAGVTAALKNMVGINGDKDYLPHHRIGSPGMNGDCYAEPHPVKRAAELAFDVANRRMGRSGYALAAVGAAALAKVALPIGIGGLDGGWHGNDTVWRMALDLNRIVRYGRVDGTMADTVQRQVLTITDAVVAGEGEGPLAPTPIDLGVITCARSSVFADLVHAVLMRFDWQRIPIVARAFDEMRWPIVREAVREVDIRLGGRALGIADVTRELARDFRAPRGWRGQIEVGARRVLA